MSNAHNPSAFPLATPERFKFSYSGMSLRDYFAAQALAGLCAADGTRVPAVAAEKAYRLADAMLEVRK